MGKAQDNEEIGARRHALTLENKWREPRALPSGVRLLNLYLWRERMKAEKARSEPVSQAFAKAARREASCSAAAWSWLAFRSSRHQRSPSLNKSVNIFVFWRTQHRIDVNSLVHISACSHSISHTSRAFHPLVGRHRFCSASVALLSLAALLLSLNSSRFLC